MIPKHSFVKRRIKGLLSIFFSSFLCFIASFVFFLAIWFIVTSRQVLVTPLPMLHTQNVHTSVVSRILYLCQQNKIMCRAITLTSTTATFFVDTNEQVIVSLQKDIPMQIASLQLTIMHLTIEGKRFHRLDFRFDKPVLTY